MTKIYLLESEKIPLPASFLNAINKILRTEEFEKYSHEKRKQVLGGMLMGKRKAFTTLTDLLEYIHLPKEKYYRKINYRLNKGLSYHHKGWIITRVPLQ